MGRHYSSQPPRNRFLAAGIKKHNFAWKVENIKIKVENTFGQIILTPLKIFMKDENS